MATPQANATYWVIASWSHNCDAGGTSEPQTLKIRYRSYAASDSPRIRDARILALRLDRFTNAHVVTSSSEPSTTSATDQDVLTLTRTPQLVKYAVLAVEAFNPASTTVSGYAQVRQGTTTLSQVVMESQNSAGYQYLGVADARRTRRHHRQRRRARHRRSAAIG